MALAEMNRTLNRRTLLSIGILVLIALPLLIAKPAFAEDISLSITVTAKDALVSTTITNNGRDIASGLHTNTTLDGMSYESGPIRDLAPGQSFTQRTTVVFPEKTGTYPLFTKVYYQNDRVELSLLNVGRFNVRQEAELDAPCALSPIHLAANKKSIPVAFDKGLNLTLFFPDEIKISNTRPENYGQSFDLENKVPQFKSNYTVYSVLENSANDPIHSTKICSTRLFTAASSKDDYRLPIVCYVASALVGLLIAAIILVRSRERDFDRLSLRDRALVRWGFSLFTVSSLLLFFYKAYTIPDLLYDPLSRLYFKGSTVSNGLLDAAKILVNWLYFEGTDYDRFGIFVATPLYFYMLLGNYFVLRYLIKPVPSKDKYWQLMLSFFSVLPFLGKKILGSSHSGFYWNRLCKIATLTLMVKAFYVPIMSSWTINNIYYGGSLARTQTWSFLKVSEAVIGALIFVDVAVFTIGYLTELPQLRNQIRSVEPTLFGWVICLMCYPPFNQFSFRMFDRPLNSHWPASQGAPWMAAHIVIGLLWVIYVWATVALGFRSSNLTNRGIVDTGPYRYIRHPAYASKVTVWALTSFFLGTMNFFLIIAQATVYSLRAWTEERHLSQDPDYLEYKKRVRWLILPRVL